LLYDRFSSGPGKRFTTPLLGNNGLNQEYIMHTIEILLNIVRVSFVIIYGTKILTTLQSLSSEEISYTHIYGDR
jgi:hypothetical protein